MQVTHAPGFSLRTNEFRVRLSAALKSSPLGENVTVTMDGFLGGGAVVIVVVVVGDVVVVVGIVVVVVVDVVVVVIAETVNVCATPVAAA